MPSEVSDSSGVDIRLNQLAGEFGVPVEARCVGCRRNDRDRVRVKLADPDVFPEDMADAGAESFKHVCHRCRKATYWNVLEVIADVVLERVDELDEHDREVPEKVVRFLDENGEERGDRSTYVRAGGKPLAVETDGGERQ